MAEYEPELVERMVALVRAVADANLTSKQEDDIQSAVWDARDIVALLPAPVDFDLLEAREIVAMALEDLKETTKGWGRMAGLREGRWDNTPAVQRAYESLRGRALALAQVHP